MIKVNGLCILPPLMAISALAHAEIPDEGLMFSHKDWDLVCARSGECGAVGYSSGEGTDGVSIAITRSQGPDTTVNAAVKFADVQSRAPIQPVSFILNGVDMGTVSPDDQFTFALDENQTSALLAALKGTADLKFADSGGTIKSVSDAGSSAVLLKMDSAQGRLDTPGAIIGQGLNEEQSVPRPPVASPPIVPPKLVESRPTDSQLSKNPQVLLALAKSLSGSYSCPGVTSSSEPSERFVERIDQTHVLVNAKCWSNDFSTAQGFWLMQDSPPYSAVLITNEGSRFDRATGTIRSWQPKRALADCMTRTFWSWDGGSFVLTYHEASERCRGFKGGAWMIPSYVR